MKWALRFSRTEGNWASLTSQHRGLLSSGYSQTFRWPSLSPRRQLFLLHSTEGGQLLRVHSKRQPHGERAHGGLGMFGVRHTKLY